MDEFMRYIITDSKEEIRILRRKLMIFMLAVAIYEVLTNSKITKIESKLDKLTKEIRLCKNKKGE